MDIARPQPGVSRIQWILLNLNREFPNPMNTIGSQNKYQNIYQIKYKKKGGPNPKAI